jgi:hypothetical protein
MDETTLEMKTKDERDIKVDITEMGDKEVNCISLDYNWAKENLMKVMNLTCRFCKNWQSLHY